MKHSSPIKSRPAGFSLLELMVASAVAIIAVSAATATLVTQLTLQNAASGRNDIAVQVALSDVIMDRQFSNATLGFGDPRYGFMVRNNVSAALPNGDGATNIPAAAAGSTAAGVITGTDVVEIASANPLIRAQGVVSYCGVVGSAPGTLCNQLNGTGIVQLVTTDPLTIPEAQQLSTVTGVAGPVIMFTNLLGTSCWGRATQLSSAVTTQVTFNYLDYNLASTTPPAATLCPANGMFVYGADYRTRYMVYQPGGATPGGSYPGSPGIYKQDWLYNTATPTSPIAYNATPTLLVAGVEDLQVKPWIGSAAAGWTSCNDAATPSCTLSTTNDWEVRRADITVTGIGAVPLAYSGTAATPPPAYLRPAIYDHTAAAPNPSGWYRAYLELSVFFPNSDQLGL